MENSHTTPSADAATDRFVLRAATGEDASAILECLRVAFEQYRPQYTAQAYLDTVMTPDSLLERLRSMTVFIAVDAQGHVIGTIGGARVSPSEGHLRGMAVPPEWQGHGIAPRLLDAIEKHLRNQGCTQISLDTTEPLQRAMRFCEKKGFSRTEKVADFFGMPLLEYVKLL